MSHDFFITTLVPTHDHCAHRHQMDIFRFFYICSFRLRILFYIDVMDVYFNNLLKINISIPTVKSLLISDSFPPLRASALPHRHPAHDCIHLKGSNVVLGCKYTKLFRKGKLLVYFILRQILVFVLLYAFLLTLSMNCHLLIIFLQCP